MLLVEVEALLFRMQDNYPQATPPRPGTAAEWITSTLATFPADLVFTAFDIWRETELWPPKLTELIAGAQAEARRRAQVSEAEAIAAANFEEPPPDPSRTFPDGKRELFGCGTCQDQRWIPLDPNDVLYEGPLMPCPTCRHVTYELWKGGHYQPGHTCSECTMRRAKRGHAA